ncbi:alanine racemase [Vagococcus luciliae]|uniref:Alanine racemase n=1 Tax=Vagococcus luciliae TaxID=2920380 RepID=A0ABY5P0Q0_9ENTE|nr:alanine racemase [Vagococcus luciliae]UUV99497.1 Alanine racemase [Vagococcus luciliae]
MIESTHRPSQVVVDLSAIEYNIKQELARLNDEQVLFAVVKANAYGHGAIEVAKACEKAGATGFCVSNLDEALELRSAGLTLPILVLSYVSTNYLDLAISQTISLTAPSLDWLKEAEDYLTQTTLTNPLSVHLKIDTGMGRIGLRDDDEMVQAKELFVLSNHMTLDGIFTHFSCADTKDTSYFELQQQRFTRAMDIFSDLEIPYIHTSNSATALWHDAWNSNMIRFGDALYGLNPSGKTLKLPYELKPALSLTTELIHVKQVSAGEKIGYGATYTAEKEEWIGTLPIGYADGLIRKFQGYHVIIDGEYAEIVGRVCMDQCMIRLSKRYAVGTPVTIFGKNGELENTLDDAAEFIDTINYEIICGLTDRLPRYYLNERINN